MQFHGRAVVKIEFTAHSLQVIDHRQNPSADPFKFQPNSNQPFNKLGENPTESNQPSPIRMNRDEFIICVYIFKWFRRCYSKRSIGLCKTEAIPHRCFEICYSQIIVYGYLLKEIIFFL